ncbi:hypothetical protein R69888_02942 [Paraburkholderia haematera]|uniref:Uncharacterized protein n=1 Tax=Paraburkholderia haematera TaxID=2793077 RepID=A0ABM8RFJ1_9BURK|nr:hypothetical protein R69888_02942 [Paraburkholderia haematera]
MVRLGLRLSAINGGEMPALYGANNEGAASGFEAMIQGGIAAHFGPSLFPEAVSQRWAEFSHLARYDRPVTLTFPHSRLFGPGCQL